MATTIKFSVSILPKIDTPVVGRLPYFYECCLTPFKVSTSQVDSEVQVISAALESAEVNVTRMKVGPQGAAFTLETAVNTVSSDSFSAAYNMIENIRIFVDAVDSLAEVSK